MLLANKNFPLVGPSRTALLGTLAALVFAAHCAGAPGTIAVTGMSTTQNGPGGFFYDGVAHMWVADASKGLCRMDPAGVSTFTLTNCVLPPTSLSGLGGVHAVVGQPAYDSVGHFAYLPDMSTASKGIWRYLFNPLTSTFGVTGANIASSLSGQRPGAVALGPDGNLYATMSATATYVRVNTPAAATQVVDNMGATLSGKPSHGLTFGDTTLWVADVDGEIFVPAATTCATKCKGTLDTQIAVPNPLSIIFDGPNSYLYIGTAAGVFQHNRLTGQTFLYSKHWVSPTASGLTTDVTAVGVDNLGNLYYIDDPTASQVVSVVGGATAGGATAYSVPFNSAPDGQGNLPSPPPTIPPSESALPPFANPALLYSTGLTTPRGAVYMGTHVWVSDATLGFCKVNPLPTPSLAACATLPLGFVPGSPAYDLSTNQLYLADTTAGGLGIVKLQFNPALETLGAATTVVSNTVLTASTGLPASAPTALAWGPDKKLYVAMTGTPRILRVTAAVKPATQPTVNFIGTMFESTTSIAFYNSDLYNVETSDSSVIYAATLCQGNCTSLFLGVVMILPTAVTSDGAYVYFGDAQKVMRFDPVANAFANMTDTGLVNGVPTPFAGVTGLATDTSGHVFAADATRLWEIAGTGAVPAVTSIAPVQAPEGSTVTVTITGTNFLAGSLVVSTCPAITPGNVNVLSLTQITATFAINPVGPIGACSVTVGTPSGVSVASSFTVLIGPAALTSVTPNSGFRGHAAVPVSIAGANMGLGTIDPIAGITVSNTVINAAGTLTTANFLISGTAALGPQNVSITTPSGQSNFLPFTINAAPPVLTSSAPLSGAAGVSVAITLTGTDLFGATINPPAGFTVSAVPAPVVTATSITATFVIASTVSAGPQSITVTGPGGTSSAMTFTIMPALTSIAVSSARTGAITAVTLTGTSLAGVTAVNAGANIVVTNIAATAGIVTATFTSALAAPLGPQSVTVTDVNGASNAVTFTLTASVPVLNTIAPNTPTTFGTGSTVAITLSGTGLAGSTLNLPAGITLSPGSLASTFSTVTANIVLAGNAPLGPQTIGVSTAGGTSNTVSITVFPLAPLLSAVAPATAAAGATITVTLTGTGFAGTTSVNTVPGAGITATIVSITATQITAQFAIAASASTQQISVTNPNGTSNTVTFGIVPTLSSISPASNPAGLTVAVTLTGTSLTGATSINAGAGITATIVSVVSSTQINASFVITAAAAQGNRNITVTTPGGTTGAVVFNVLPPPPAITALNAPFKRGSNQGVSLAGTSLTGANTIAAVQVLLNGTALPTTAWAVTGFAPGATQLKWSWTMPGTLPASSGTQVYTMTVTTPSGTSAPFGFAVQ